jgi:hypothetical protein
MYRRCWQSEGPYCAGFLNAQRNQELCSSQSREGCGCRMVRHGHPGFCFYLCNLFTMGAVSHVAIGLELIG